MREGFGIWNSACWARERKAEGEQSSQCRNRLELIRELAVAILWYSSCLGGFLKCYCMIVAGLGKLRQAYEQSKVRNIELATQFWNDCRICLQYDAWPWRQATMRGNWKYEFSPRVFGNSLCGQPWRTVNFLVILAHRVCSLRYHSCVITVKQDIIRSAWFKQVYRWYYKLQLVCFRLD